MHPVFVPFSSPNPMSPVLELNSDRRQDLIETYAETMIEGMDYKTMEQLVYDPVSYTHLTLPTICSV